MWNLVEEAGCRGDLDTACSKSVAGSEWIERYTKHISSFFADSLEVTSSSKVYQFGGGEKRISKRCVCLPTLIGDKKMFISVDIVDASIPLLMIQFDGFCQCNTKFSIQNCYIFW